jgi:hypothetical protein
MGLHHPLRKCFTNVDFTNAPIVIVTDFTEGQVYQYDFTLFPIELAAFQLTPNGHYFNAAIRNTTIPFLRL